MVKGLKEFIKKSNIVIWGYGTIAAKMFDLCSLVNISLVECVDSSAEKQGMSIECNGINYTIKDPAILNDLRKNYNIIVTPHNSDMILLDLNKMGYEKDAYITVSYIEVMALFLDVVAASCDLYAKENDCKISYIFFPYAKDIIQPSILEDTLKGYEYIIKDRIEWLKGNPPHIVKAHENLKYYSDDYIKNIFTGKHALRRNTGELIQKEQMSKYVNVINGMRVTTDQPIVYERKVHIFGPSLAYGFGVEDRYTLASCLQRLLNEKAENYYKVFNYGLRGLPLDEYIYKIRSANISNGDSILCVIRREAVREYKEILSYHEGKIVDLTDWFQRPHKYGEIFFDGLHFNYKGYLAAAEIIFNLLFTEKNEKINFSKNAPNIIRNNNEFDSYMDYLEVCKKDVCLDAEAVIGGIVVNANPFTLGHFYLIDIASKIVDFLYVFVVEEDLSDFSFEDRYNLVKKGTEQFSNVKVIRSGKFIISNITFPEYFDKDNATEHSRIVPSLDIEIFGEFIAKKLGISIRFVGEEPTDYVTKQYNKYMMERLPLYGIRLIEIPRKKQDNGYISAKRVRKLVAEGKFDDVRTLVPPRHTNTYVR